MTTIPPESQDRPHASDPMLETPQSPETLARALNERIHEDVDSFSSDTFSRVGAISQLEAGLSPEAARSARTNAGLQELPSILEEARTLGDHAAASIKEAAARPVVSDRTLRALRREFPQEEISHTSVEIPEKPSAVESIEEERLEAEEQKRLPMEVFRLQRDLKLASAVERLEQGERLEQREIEMISGALEGRGWQRLCAEVHAGDGLAAFLVPNAEHFSIKKFNDHLFGMQKTDDIIKFRRDTLWKEASMLGLERMATSYKDEFYRIPKDEFQQEGREAMMKSLSEASERVRVAMTSKLVELAAEEWDGAQDSRKAALDAFVQSMLGEQGYSKYLEQRGLFLASQRAWRSALEQESKVLREQFAGGSGDEERIAEVTHAKELASATYRLFEQARYGFHTEAVVPALKQHANLGYRITFGVNEVGEEKEGSYEHIERSVSASLKGAMVARRQSEQGTIFSKEDAEQAIDRVIELRDRIGIQDLMDAEGRVYPVLEARPDGKGTMVNLMSLDLIREIRKGTFKPANDAQHQSLFRVVKEYMEAVNIFDVTKPYLHEELAGGVIAGTEQTISESVDQTKHLAKRLHQGGLAEHERLEIARLLKQDGKDRACSSVMEFHRKALEISHCSYVSLDALDIGPELLQEYELLVQRVKNGRMTFDEAQLIAGDATTKKMRVFRARIIEAYKQLCHGEEPIMSVGGDEVTLAMDTEKITDAFLLELRSIRLHEREGGSVRVVKTAIGTGERESVLKGEVRMKEHLEAIKRAEEGTAIAKEIEKTIREIRSFINDLPQSDREANRALLAGLNLETFAVHQHETDSRFELILQSADSSQDPIRANLEGKMDELHQLSARLSQAVQERRSAFFAEYQKSHPKLTMELVPIALRRKDQSERGFESYMRTLA